jgi:uncharacterized protein
VTDAAFVQPMLGIGQVRHKRLYPVANCFVYPTYFLLLPMRSLKAGIKTGQSALAVNRFGAISFYDRDHGDGRGPSQGGALQWIDNLLAAEGITDATGEVWLQCYPRVLGYAFKPVSFWYCHLAACDRGGALRAIVVEVNNTFGERHCYLLNQAQWGNEIAAYKEFHVSPFCQVAGQYRFRFMQRSRDGAKKSIARIDLVDASGPVLQTSLSGDLQPLTRSALRRAFWRYPGMTFGVILHIHWQALRLWLKQVNVVSRPAVMTDQFVTRQIDTNATLHKPLPDAQIFQP